MGEGNKSSQQSIQSAASNIDMRLEELQLKYDTVSHELPQLQQNKHEEFNSWKVAQRQAIELQRVEGKLLHVAATTALEEAAVVKREAVEHRRASEEIRITLECDTKKLSDATRDLDTERRAFHALRDAGTDTDKVSQFNLNLAEDSQGITRPPNTTTINPILRHVTSYPLVGPQGSTPPAAKKSVSFEEKSTVIEDPAAAPASSDATMSEAEVDHVSREQGTSAAELLAQELSSADGSPAPVTPPSRAPPNTARTPRFGPNPR